MMVVESPTEKTTPLEEAPTHAHDCSWRLEGEKGVMTLSLQQGLEMASAALARFA
jgi:hypothetical protein